MRLIEVRANHELLVTCLRAKLKSRAFVATYLRPERASEERASEFSTERSWEGRGVESQQHREKEV